jgi:hypothetical protein
MALITRSNPSKIRCPLESFELVDNLGTFSIPSRTGLIIPSGYDNYF